MFLRTKGLHQLFRTGSAFRAASKTVGDTGKTIEELFDEKMKEYQTKGGGKIYEPTKEITEELEAEYARINRQYGVTDYNEYIKFPTFEFKEPVIDPINEDDATNEAFMKIDTKADTKAEKVSGSDPKSGETDCADTTCEEDCTEARKENDMVHDKKKKGDPDDCDP